MTTDPGSPEDIDQKMQGRHPSIVDLMKFFAYSHLPVEQRRISQSCYVLASGMVSQLEDGPELIAGLRKLLEAKDCFVRQSLKFPDR